MVVAVAKVVIMIMIVGVAVAVAVTLAVVVVVVVVVPVLWTGAQGDMTIVREVPLGILSFKVPSLVATGFH